MSLAVGNHADVAIPNCLIEQVGDDGSYALLSLPYDGTSVDSDGNKVFVKYWFPVNDSRVTITQVTPANWPPQENDIWTVTGVNNPPVAFVVAAGTGTLYFLTAANIRNEFAGNKVTPLSTDDALAQYGNSLALLHRGDT
jgi:hypothetical protein